MTDLAMVTNGTVRAAVTEGTLVTDLFDETIMGPAIEGTLVNDLTDETVRAAMTEGTLVTDLTVVTDGTPTVRTVIKARGPTLVEISYTLGEIHRNLC